jgi:molybdopterin-guanine dinucleotide biosynthesis protein A
MLPVLRAALAEGQRDVREAVGRGRVKYLHLSDDGGLCNLNTREEYETYLSGER